MMAVLWTLGAIICGSFAESREAGGWALEVRRGGGGGEGSGRGDGERRICVDTKVLTR